MTTQKPEALRLAEMLTADEWPGSVTLVSYARECVAELLRQHAENETLRVGYAAARLEVESLKAQAGAVPLDEARHLFDAGWKAAALFCDREDVVADGIIGFGACPQFEAAFSAAQGIKGGQP